MQIEIFTVCDNAQNYQGKLVIVGTFNQIRSNKFPFIYGGFSIVGRIGYETEYNENFNLSFIDPNGKNVIDPLTWDSLVKVIDNTTGYADFNMALNQIQFETPGTYQIILKTKEEKRIFKLYLVEQQAK